MFTSSGAPKPAATALHILTTLLADKGGAFTPGTLGYSLSGTLSTDHSMLLEKSDGTFWLALWNEARLSGPTSPTTITVPNHTVTISLAATAGTVQVFDPMSGTSAQRTLSTVGTVAVSVPDHPILVEISPAAAAPQDLSISMPAAPSLSHGALSALVGVDTVTVNAWNQAGVSSTHALTIHVT